MAESTGTPLWKKLGLKGGLTAQLVHAPTGWSVPDAPADVAWVDETTTTSVDLVVAFFGTAADYAAELVGLAERVFPAGALWIAWPRKAGGHTSDLGDVVVRDTALPTGLVDVKVAALDNDWSSLKFVWRLTERAASPSNA